MLCVLISNLVLICKCHHASHGNQLMLNEISVLK